MSEIAELRERVDTLAKQLAEQVNWNRATRTALAALSIYLERLQRPEDKTFIEALEDLLAPRDGMATNSGIDAGTRMVKGLAMEANSLRATGRL